MNRDLLDDEETPSSKYHVLFGVEGGADENEMVDEEDQE